MSIDIDSIGVHAPAVPEAVDATGALGVPSVASEVGWWMPSTAELVLDGHVDMVGTGAGALFEVRALRPGALVVVHTDDVLHPRRRLERWVIDGVRTYAKGSLPAGLFNGAGPRLVLVTCGGPFDPATHHYEDNVVAYASPAGRTPGA